MLDLRFVKYAVLEDTKMIVAKQDVLNAKEVWSVRHLVIKYVQAVPREDIKTRQILANALIVHVASIGTKARQQNAMIVHLVL